MSQRETAVRVAKIEIAALSVADFCQTVRDWSLRSERPRAMAYFNAHTFSLCFDCPHQLEAMERSDLVYADGMGIVWGYRLLRRELPERINAGDLFDQLCRQLEGERCAIYFLGGAEPDAKLAARRCAQLFPGLKVVGAENGYFEAGQQEEQVLERLRAAAPSLLLLGMGSPRQEQFALRCRQELGIPLTWSVGALFEYLSGRRPRAPVLMRRMGLEWLWRLALEPRRLAGRYLWGLPKFAYRLWLVARSNAR